jgi:hypothetical protein
VGARSILFFPFLLLACGFPVSPAFSAEIVAIDNGATAAVDNVAAKAEAKPADVTMKGLEALIGLLHDKGVFSAEEARIFVDRLKGTAAAPAEAPSAQGAAAMPLAAEGKAEEVERVRMSGEDLKAMIDSLRDQGILAVEEADGLAGRLTPPDGPGRKSDRKTPIVTEGKEFPYLPSTQPDVYLRTMIDLLRAQGIVSPEEAAILNRRVSKKAYTDKIAAGIARMVRRDIQQQVPEVVRKQVKEEVREEVAKETKSNPIPEWTKRIRLSGDFRLRAEGNFFGPNNADLLDPANPAQVLNTHEDRYRFRLRARLNLNAKISDRLETNFRLATGTLTAPVSTNQTLGDYGNKKSFVLDQGYVKWTTPQGLIAWGGRMPNPWFSTDLVWDPDLNFDGVAVTYSRQFTPAVGGFLTVGAFPLQEVELSSRDKWLFGGQLGAQYKPRKELAANLGVAFYDYENIVGKANDPALPGALDFTAPPFVQKGNTIFDIDPSTALKVALASEFRELNITGALDVGFWHPVHFVFLGDYVKNLGFNRNDVAQRTGNPDVKAETTGYQAGLAVGYPAVGSFGEWKGFLFYKHLEENAVVDAFTDSDFHLGGTNAQGWILGGEFGLARNVWLATKWLTANEISGPPLAIDVFFLDLNVKF